MVIPRNNNILIIYIIRSISRRIDLRSGFLDFFFLFIFPLRFTKLQDTSKLWIDLSGDTFKGSKWTEIDSSPFVSLHTHVAVNQENKRVPEYRSQKL
jgi:hypothetical protein